MRFNLKHWFIMVALTEAMIFLLLRPLSIAGAQDLLWAFFLVMPIFVTVIMFMMDFMVRDSEKRWAAEAKKHADIKRTAVKVIDINGLHVAFHKDFVHIYKDDERLLYMKIDSVKWLAKQIQELGL